MGAFYLFPRVGASQAREFQIATTTTTTPPRKTAFFSTKSSRSVLACFCNVFLQNTPKHFFFKQCFQFPCLHKPLKTPLFTLFSSIFPCSNAAGQLKHIYKQSFKNIVFVYSVFTMFSVKNTVIYTFSGIKSVQNTGFCSVFNALASKNHSKYRYLLFTVFFHFCPFFHCRKPTKMTPKFHFNTLLSSDTQKSSKNLANTT